MGNKNNSLALILLLGGAIWYLSRRKDEEETPRAIISDEVDPEAIYGCTNPVASNYNPNATNEDGSCIEIVGCMESDANNYNPQATINAGCDYSTPPVYGCMDEAADNYDANATANQGCIYSGCTDIVATNYNAYATVDDGSCSYNVLGCTDPLACNHNPEATEGNASSELCIYPQQYKDCDGNCIEDLDNDGVCNEEEVFGCTDTAANNFQSSATEDDGSCTYTVFGCTDPAASNYDPEATTDAGNLTSSSACLYAGCPDPSATNYTPGSNIDDGSCIYEENPLLVPGCNDFNAINFDINATVDDGSCIYEEEEEVSTGVLTAKEQEVWDFMLTNMLPALDYDSNLMWEFLSPAYGGGNKPFTWTTQQPPTVPVADWDVSLCQGIPGNCIVDQWSMWTESYDLQ